MYPGAPGNLAGIATPVGGYPNLQPIGVAKGGSPGQHTPGWDKGWPPKPTPKPTPNDGLTFQNLLGGSNLPNAINNMTIAHARPDGRPHSGGPEHDFMHGRRGSGTWGDGTARDNPLYHQGGKRTFADGTPVTSKNYGAFKMNPDIAPGVQ